MQIVIETASLKYSDEIMNDIFKSYRDKISKASRMRREIFLKNRDSIKFISSKSQTDGLRADAAIGLHAYDITHASRLDKRIWEFDDLINHFKSI
jgi:hypothetical protein